MKYKAHFRGKVHYETEELNRLLQTEIKWIDAEIEALSKDKAREIIYERYENVKSLTLVKIE